MGKFEEYLRDVWEGCWLESTELAGRYLEDIEAGGKGQALETLSKAETTVELTSVGNPR